MRLRQTETETPLRDLFEFRNLWLFLVGSICLAIVGEGIFNLLEGGLQDGWSYFGTPEGRVHVLAVLIALLFVFLLVLLIQIRLRVLRRLHERPVKPEMAPIEPHPGIIVLVSTNPRSAEQHIIEHHWQSLRYCWLITSHEARAQSEHLAANLEQRGVDARRVDLADVHSIESAYIAIRDAIQEARHTPRVADRVVVDITGSTKLVSVGAVLACLDQGIAIEYLATQRDAQGKEIPGTEKVLQITFPETLDHTFGGFLPPRESNPDAVIVRH
jgi:hypothetical protein